MDIILDNLGLIIFIGFIIMSTVFNSVGSIIKKAAEAAENSRDYQEGPQKFNPLGNESAEEFFARMQEEQKPKKKLKLSNKPKLEPQNQSLPDAIEDKFEFETPATEKIQSLPETTKKKTEGCPKIDFRDKSTLRKSIIINEVLGRPASYKF